MYIWDLGEHRNFYGFPSHSLTTTANTTATTSAGSNNSIAEGAVYDETLSIDTAVKVAYHQDPSPSSDTHTTEPTPITINRSVEPHEIEQMRTLLSEKIPSLYNQPLVYTTTCMYTTIPSDEHFLIDFHPTYQGNNDEKGHNSDLSNRVLIVSACSGHGFKFGSVIGELAADLLMGGIEEETIEEEGEREKGCSSTCNGDNSNTVNSSDSNDDKGSSKGNSGRDKYDISLFKFRW